MAVASAAVLVGIFIGLLVRPVIDAYLAFKTAELYRDEAMGQHDHRPDVRTTGR